MLVVGQDSTSLTYIPARDIAEDSVVVERVADVVILVKNVRD